MRGKSNNNLKASSLQRKNTLHNRKMMLDFDSTVYPLLVAMAEESGKDISYQKMPTWEYLAEACGGFEEMVEILKKVTKFPVMKKYPPFPGVKKVLDSFSSRGLEIHVLSHRFNDDAPHIKQYFQYYQLPFTTINCQKEREKIKWCLQENIDILIDDSPDTLKEASHSGIQCATLLFPYNKDSIDPSQAKEDWHALAEVIENTLLHKVN